MTHSRELAPAGLRRRRMLEPLYTADEMQRGRGAATTVEELMERAGRAVAEEAMRRFPERAALRRGLRRGSQRRRRADRARGARSRPEGSVGRPRTRRSRRRTSSSTRSSAPASTASRAQDAARQIEQINAAGAPVVAVDLPSGVDASTGEVAGACVDADRDRHVPRRRRSALDVAPGRFRAGEVVVADIGLEPLETEHRLVTPAILTRVPRRQRRAEQVHGRAPCSSSAARAG